MDSIKMVTVYYKDSSGNINVNIRNGVKGQFGFVEFCKIMAEEKSESQIMFVAVDNRCVYSRLQTKEPLSWNDLIDYFT